jgi:hypothetical protein
MSTENENKISVTDAVSVDALVDSITVEGEVTFGNVLTICLSLMQLVERYPKLKGSEKKDLVIRGIQHIISKKGGNDSVMALVPVFIDKAVAINNGEISLNVPKNLFSCCVKK